ncbi:MAG: hypothetical protein SFW36_05500 [Leptolyngbyaceae cyanobacterium bins.59]|nr:hypothetical protein [Leptolyngbyaceae cyanobacterium bins.59]
MAVLGMSAANLLQFNLFGEPDELAGSGVDEPCNEALDDQLDEKLDELLDQAATGAIEAVEAEAVPVALEPEAIADLVPSSNVLSGQSPEWGHRVRLGMVRSAKSNLF